MIGRPATQRGPGLPGLILVITLLTPPEADATTWRVPGDAPTIQAGIDLAQPGDDVLIAPGIYPEHDIVMKGGIRVHSEQGAAVTIVDAQSAGRVFLCSDFQDEATIEGLTIRNGSSGGTGGGVWCIRANLRIEECVVTGCFAGAQGGGVYNEEGSVQILRCEISGNHGNNAGGGVAGLNSSIEILHSDITTNRSVGSGGGISSRHATRLTIQTSVVALNRGDCWGGGIVCDGTFDIRDCLIVDNRAIQCGIGWALLLTGTGSIVGCTVARNDGHGSREVILLGGADVSIERTVVAFHDGGDAVVCEDSQARFRCCDVYGNRNNDLCGEDLGGNFSADPLFCDAPNGDYSLDGGSPCLPGQHPDGVDCGLTGALGWGCGAPPAVGACCFPDGSCLLLGAEDCENEQGNYQGDGTACDPNPCVPTPTERTSWGRIRAHYR